MVVSQCFVWGAIVTGRFGLYFWEELGWAVLIAANAAASAALWPERDALGDAGILLTLNLLFAAVYLVWQVPNLRLQRADARRARQTRSRCACAGPPLREGLRRSLHERHATTDATAWGGLVVLLWMAGYFATLLPLWAHTIVAVFSR